MHVYTWPGFSHKGIYSSSKKFPKRNISETIRVIRKRMKYLMRCKKKSDSHFLIQNRNRRVEPITYHESKFVDIAFKEALCRRKVSFIPIVVLSGLSAVCSMFISMLLHQTVISHIHEGNIFHVRSILKTFCLDFRLRWNLFYFLSLTFPIWVLFEQNGNEISGYEGHFLVFFQSEVQQENTKSLKQRRVLHIVLQHQLPVQLQQYNCLLFYCRLFVSIGDSRLTLRIALSAFSSNG